MCGIIWYAYCIIMIITVISTVNFMFSSWSTLMPFMNLNAKSHHATKFYIDKLIDGQGYGIIKADLQIHIRLIYIYLLIFIN